MKQDAATAQSEMPNAKRREMDIRRPEAAAVQARLRTFGVRANSRAMNPAGSDNGHLADWFYDPIYRYSQPEIRVAIVNA